MRGFTLIETMVYLALYAILIGGAITAAFGMFESAERNQMKAMVELEGIYLIGKIDWALTGATTVDVSPTGTLYVNRSGISASDNPLIFDVAGGMLRLTRGAGIVQSLNNTNVSVGSLTFVHATSSGDGTNPESIKASFSLNARTPNGLLYSQNFETVKYLRK